MPQARRGGRHRRGIIRLRREDLRQGPQQRQPDQQIGMPEGEAVGEQEGEFQRKMRIKNGKTDAVIEVDDDRSWGHGLRRTDAGIEADHGGPADRLHELLLNETPLVIDVPAQPGQFDTAELAVPFSRSIADHGDLHRQRAKRAPVSLAGTVFDLGPALPCPGIVITPCHHCRPAGHFARSAVTAVIGPTPGIFAKARKFSRGALPRSAAPRINPAPRPASPAATRLRPSRA